MKEIQEKLKKWRVERNLDNNEFVVNVEVSNLLEECAEFLRAKDDYEKIDALCDISVFSINAISYINQVDYIIYIDAINKQKQTIYDVARKVTMILSNSSEFSVFLLSDIIESCYILVENMGYNYKECMLETIKEISSRQQDTIQKKEWAENGVSGKWQKDKNQDASTLYKADYESCKK